MVFELRFKIAAMTELQLYSIIIRQRHYLNNTVISTVPDKTGVPVDGHCQIVRPSEAALVSFKHTWLHPNDKASIQAHSQFQSVLFHFSSKIV